ncbi:MAG: hypothetical protein Ta2A_15310 [Treponemataceae bacterium]|nr:MAG: hypothetical protein Ta2A_15310 [Treponemataceae bacterium]
MNITRIQTLLPRLCCRVGGGIKTAAKAKSLIELGADKVIIGSAAFCRNALNTQFLDELTKAIGKQRVILAIDAIAGKIAVKGWTEATDIALFDNDKPAAILREAQNYCSEFLYTCVEKEGLMQGADIENAKTLRAMLDAEKYKLVIAGGIKTLDEIVALQKCECDVQLGMALYTNAIKLQDAFIECLNWDKVPLIPVIAQSAATGEVLMMGYANREAFAKTFETKKLTFWSRTRNELWTKGRHSGKFLGVVKLRADCDRDTVLATVVPHGEVCHTGSWNCFSASAAPVNPLVAPADLRPEIA